MKIEIKGTIEASPMGTSAEEVKKILEEALVKAICPPPYSVEVETKEV